MGRRNKNDRRDSSLHYLGLLQDKNSYSKTIGIAIGSMFGSVLLATAAACAGTYLSGYFGQSKVATPKDTALHIVPVLLSTLVPIATVWGTMRQRFIEKAKTKAVLEARKALQIETASSGEHESEPPNHVTQRNGFWVNLILRDPDMEQRMGDIDEDYPNIVADLGAERALRWRRDEIARAYWSVLKDKLARLFQKTATK